MNKSDFEEWSAKLSEVQGLTEDEHFKCFDELTGAITGEEDVVFLRRLIEVVYVEDDFGVYEGLYNAVWRFSGEVTAVELARALPRWVVPSQNSFFRPILHTPERLNAFIQTALQWKVDERQHGCKHIFSWSWHSAKDEEDWKPVLTALGSELVPAMPEDSVPEHWPPELQEKLSAWRELPPENTSKKVFWQGRDRDVWRSELPWLIEALSISQGKKWRDIKVWLNPFTVFAKELYHYFLDSFAKTAPDVRERALANIKRLYLPDVLASQYKWALDFNELIRDLDARTG